MKSAADVTEDSTSAAAADLHRALNNGQHSNVDDHIVFAIYFDEAVLFTTSPGESTIDKWRAEVAEAIYPLITDYKFTVAPAFSITWLPKSAGTEPSCEDVGHFECSLRVGDNSEEEWLVLSELLQITARLNYVTVKVWDGDGEFPLLQAANYLPGWLNPEAAKSHFWIRNGTFILLPKDVNNTDCLCSPSDAAKDGRSTNLSIAKALRFVIQDARSGRNMSTLPTAALHSIESRLKPVKAVRASWVTVGGVRAESSLARDKQESNDNLLLSLNKLHPAMQCYPHRCCIIVPAPVAVLLQKFPPLLGIALDHLPPSDPDIARKLKSNNADGPKFKCDTETRTVCISITLNRSQVARMRSFVFTLPLEFSFARWKFPGSTSFASKRAVLTARERSLRVAMTDGARICLGLQCAYSISNTQLFTMPFPFWSPVDATIVPKTGSQSQAESNSIADEYQPKWSKWNELWTLKDVFETMNSTIVCGNPPECISSSTTAVESDESNEDHLQVRCDGASGCCCGIAKRCSDAEDWLVVSDESVAEMLKTWGEEDRYMDLIRQEFRDASRVSETLNRGEAFAESAIVSEDTANKSRFSNEGTGAVEIEGVEDMEAMDRELKEMYLKFKDFMKQVSPFDGVVDPAPTDQVRRRVEDKLKDILPSDYMDLLHTYAEGMGSESEEDSSSEESDDISFDNDFFCGSYVPIQEKSLPRTNLSQLPMNSTKLTADIQPMLKAMDRELMEHDAAASNRAAMIPSASTEESEIRSLFTSNVKQMLTEQADSNSYSIIKNPQFAAMFR